MLFSCFEDGRFDQKYFESPVSPVDEAFAQHVQHLRLGTRQRRVEEYRRRRSQGFNTPFFFQSGTGPPAILKERQKTTLSLSRCAEVATQTPEANQQMGVYATADQDSDETRQTAEMSHARCTSCKEEVDKCVYCLVTVHTMCLGFASSVSFQGRSCSLCLLWRIACS